MEVSQNGRFSGFAIGFSSLRLQSEGGGIKRVWIDELTKGVWDAMCEIGVKNG